MDTVLGVDLQLEFFACLIFNILVNLRWAESFLGGAKLVVGSRGNVGEVRLDFEMRRLVMIVVSARSAQVCQKVKSEHTVMLRVFNRLALVLG